MTSKLAKGKDFQLETFAEIVDWSGKKIDENLAHKLIIGDIVRVMILFPEGGWGKYYVKITKTDKYKKGGIYNTRKFHGTIIDTYILDKDDKYVGLDITFRKENILEIPNWHS